MSPPMAMQYDLNHPTIQRAEEPKEPCHLARWADDGGRQDEEEEPPMPGDKDAPYEGTGVVSALGQHSELDYEPDCEGPGCRYCAHEEVLEQVREELEASGEYEPITLEAHGLVFGDRNRDYGHPIEDFSRTAAFWTAYLGDKLKPGEIVTAEDVGILMCLLKLSRQRNREKRDNLVDLAGYAETVQRIIDCRKGVKGA